MRRVWFAFSVMVMMSRPGQTNAQDQKSSLLPGLVAKATDGQRTVVFVTPTPNFNLTSRQSIHPQLKPDWQKTEWSGFLSIVRGGKYSLVTGEARVLVDGQEIKTQPLQLEPGEHPLSVVYQHRPDAPARLQLRWQSDFFKLESIPSTVFGHRELPPEYDAQTKIARGRELVEELNCIGCHKTESELLKGRSGPELTGIGSRTSADWIFHWLGNPRHFRPEAVMPALLQTDQDRADVAAYLGGLKEPKSDGAERLPKKELLPKETRINHGKELFNSIGCTACHGEKGISLSGLGSKMEAKPLAKYLQDPLAVDPSGRMPHMGLNLEDAAQIAEYLVQSKNLDFEKPAPAGDAKRGKALVAGSGCLNCHSLENDSAKFQTTLTAPALKSLTANKGCLAGQPVGKSPRYHLTKEDRDSLAAFLQSQDISEAPVQDFQRLVNQFRCNACHELYGPATASFAQMPPPLTDAGNKLRASWLDEVLNKHKRVRPWMALRMPHYGIHNLSALANDFAAQAGAELGDGEKAEPPSLEQIQRGVKLIGKGEGGLSCIACHDFRGEKSGGEMRGPDMTEMDARIRADWLRRWLREPSRIIAGTAMPAFFSAFPEAQTEKMIGELTAALSAGKNMPAPTGLSDEAQTYLLLVKDEPILLRTFMPDSSPRSIAVGLPGSQSYCFDAQLCRLRYAWVGDFLDVKPVWANRGGQKANILGRKYYTAPDVFPLRIGNPDKEPAVKFRGYRLVNRIPEFMYDADGVPVHERITAAAKGPGLVRTFEVAATKEDIWFLAGECDGVSISSSAGAFSNGRLKIAGGKPAHFVVTILTK